MSDNPPRHSNPHADGDHGCVRVSRGAWRERAAGLLADVFARSLDMHPFETATVFLSVLLVQFMVHDGTSTYLQVCAPTQRPHCAGLLLVPRLLQKNRRKRRARGASLLFVRVGHAYNSRARAPESCRVPRRAVRQGWMLLFVYVMISIGFIYHDSDVRSLQPASLVLVIPPRRRWEQSGHHTTPLGEQCARGATCGR